MLHFQDRSLSLCDGLSRRDWLRLGSLGAFGLSMPQLWQSWARASENRNNANSSRHAKSCIVLFLLGGPPQHETFDPKPEAPAEIRGDIGTIPTSIPGYRVGELMPLTARHVDKLAILRAVSSQDNSHSSSGYAMTTGVAHAPRGVENASPGAPNNWPNIGAIVRYLKGDPAGIPSAITLPERLANDGNRLWPGQDAGFLGRSCDPWVLQCDPSAENFNIPEVTLRADVSDERLDHRLSLLRAVNTGLNSLDQSPNFHRFNLQTQQALDLLRSEASRRAFDLSRESAKTRERYGMNRFGQSVLLARRLVEAGVSLTQVSWTRIAGALNNGHWDTHRDNSPALRRHLMPRMDQAYSALLEDLHDRGMLDDTLVVWMGEFGRTPRINGNGGRDHWSPVFSLALAGGGIRGGVVHGQSDRVGAFPIDGRVSPEDLTATIFHTLGYAPDTEMRDSLNRPLPISRGQIIRQIF